MPHFEFIQKKMTKYGGEWGGEFMIIYVVGGGTSQWGGSHFGGGGIDPGRNHVQGIQS